ncbi:MAG: matrixin family metalloprotease, partial [Pirellulaceae bacterium]
MASHFPQRQVSSLYEKSLRRNRLRRILLEKLDRRELLAADVGAGIFAGGTSQEYIDAFDWALAGGGNDNGGGSGSGDFNVGATRWSNPVGGPSLNNGDPAEITWSIVPDGTTDTANNSSTNLVAFMDGIYGGGSGPVEQRPWFNIFERAYDRWSEVSGITFVYEPFDDGAPMGQGNRGVEGVRGDVRIGGRPIDGNFGVLAFNYFPNGGGNAGFDGDMIIDTNDAWYLQNADSATGENRGLFNVLMHEAGHGVGLGHSIPLDSTKLMEPAVTFAFLGAQHDDILGTHQLYGDNAEPNDTVAQAVDLGQLSNGRQTISGNSIDRPGDDDWYQFSAPSSGRISLTLEPIGFTYEIGNQFGTTATVNTLVTQDLSLELISGGSVIAQASATNAGENEEIIDFD